MERWLLGIDIGGTGSRAALRETGSGERLELQGEVVSIGASGSSVPEIARALIDAAAASRPEGFARLRGIGLGASGLASLVPDPARLPDELAAAARAQGAPADLGSAVAIDAATAHLGALGGAPGAVVALGTGAIALGTDGGEVWRRVDGWGHLLGDRGGGAWVGLHGLELAMRAHDDVAGEDEADGTALLHAAVARFGEPGGWPAQLYTRDDRAAVLAGFAPAVVELAHAGDRAAMGILSDAGSEAARSAVAALGVELPPRVALTGGLARAAAAIRAAFAAELTRLRPDAEPVDPAGDPLAGAILLAERAADHRVRSRAPFVWADR